MKLSVYRNTIEKYLVLAYRTNSVYKKPSER
jgi:hypothetical protein